MVVRLVVYLQCVDIKVSNGGAISCVSAGDENRLIYTAWENSQEHGLCSI
jgi:hypothetical protein